MKKALKWFWWDLKYAAWVCVDWCVRLAGALLPRWLVEQAVIRAIVHGTQGKYGTTIVPEVRAMTILKRWETPNV